MKQSFVYVQDMHGNPLMPTRRFGKVRRMLDAHLAVPVTTVSFTIRLTYEPKTRILQQVVAGPADPGRTNIGAAAVRSDGTCLFAADIETRNKEVPKRMAERKAHRMASRRGERLARKRLAKRLHTTMKAILKRKLPGYGEGYVTVKDIINTEAKFNNRKRPEGWLTPTANQLLETHRNVLNLIRKILPVTDTVLEINKFAFLAMDHPGIRRWEYAKGPLYGHGSVEEAVKEQQGGKCLLCRKEKKLHYHHIVPKTKGGSNTLPNIAGLCEECHKLVHTSQEKFDELQRKKEGMNKKYGALSVLNQIIPKLTQELEKQFPGHTYVTTGRETKASRDKNSVRKDHATDAYRILSSILPDAVMQPPQEPQVYRIKQFRRHDRARICHQFMRTYRLDGKIVAKNRKRACEQREGNQKNSFPFLEEWYQKMVQERGEKEAQYLRSNLKVTKSYRSYNNVNRVLPGAVYLYQGKRYVLGGQKNKGYYYYPVGEPERRMRAKECQVIQRGGLVFLDRLAA